jgi:hypothetical protein
MTGRAMRWAQAAKRDQANAAALRGPKQIIPIAIDQTFWKAWRDDPAAMKAAGYRVTKDRAGRWRAWIER